MDSFRLDCVADQPAAIELIRKTTAIMDSAHDVILAIKVGLDARRRREPDKAIIYRPL